MTKTGLTYFKKGSKAAKKHMAQLRAMRGKKKGKRRRRERNFPAVDLLVGAAAVKSIMGNPSQRTTRAKFIRERLEPPGKFDRRSFRITKRGSKEIVIGCPKGHWDARRKRCKVGTRAQSILHPMTKKAMEKVRTNPRFTIGRGPTERKLTEAQAQRMMKNPNKRHALGIYASKKGAQQALPGIKQKFENQFEGFRIYQDRWKQWIVDARVKTKRRLRREKRNPILQTVGLAAANPPHAIEIPFRPGQKISIAEARAWVESTGDRELKKQFEAAYRLQCKANWKPKYVRWQVFPMGDSKRIDAVTALVHYGKTDATLYKPPKGSKKGNHYYKHEWGKGKGQGRHIPLLASSDGKLLLSPLMKGQVADDWLRG